MKDDKYTPNTDLPSEKNLQKHEWEDLAEAIDQQVRLLQPPRQETKHDPQEEVPVEIKNENELSAAAVPQPALSVNRPGKSQVKKAKKKARKWKKKWQATQANYTAYRKKGKKKKMAAAKKEARRQKKRYQKFEAEYRSLKKTRRTA